MPAPRKRPPTYGFKGKRHTAEAKAKIKASNTGQKRTPEQCRNISAGLIAAYERNRKAVKAQPDKKRCGKCKKWKLMACFSPCREKLKDGRIAIRPSSQCKECRAAYVRAYRKRLEAEGVDVKAKQREYNARRNRKQVRARARELGMAKRREEGKRANGGHKKHRPRQGPEIGRGAVLYQAEPLACFLEEHLGEHKVHTNEATARSLLADGTGVPIRRIRSILHREQATVTLDIVDRLLVGLGCPDQIHVLYPDTSVGYHVLDPGVAAETRRMAHYRAARPK